jgi:purine nucleoside phosphorylase
MRLTDHINFLGENPLRGGAAEGASRFLDLSQTYDPGLADLLVQAAGPPRCGCTPGLSCRLGTELRNTR